MTYLSTDANVIINSTNAMKIQKFHEMAWKLATLSYNPALITPEQLVKHFTRLLQSSNANYNNIAAANVNSTLNELIEEATINNISSIVDIGNDTATLESLDAKLQEINEYMSTINQISAFEMSDFVTNYPKWLETDHLRNSSLIVKLSR